MALLRTKDVRKMSPQEMEAKLKELKFELARSGVTANKTHAKPREIKRAIARINTVNASKQKEVLKSK